MGLYAFFSYVDDLGILLSDVNPGLKRDYGRRECGSRVMGGGTDGWGKIASDI